MCVSSTILSVKYSYHNWIVQIKRIATVGNKELEFSVHLTFKKSGQWPDTSKEMQKTLCFRILVTWSFAGQKGRPKKELSDVFITECVVICFINIIRL